MQSPCGGHPSHPRAPQPGQDHAPKTYRVVELIASRVDDQQRHLVLAGADPVHGLLVVQPLDALPVHRQHTVPFLHPCLLGRQPHIHIPQELACHSRAEGGGRCSQRGTGCAGPHV